MAFGPKKKHSKSRSKTRTTNWIQLTARKLANRVSLNAEKTGLAHFIDENGMYKGEQKIAQKTKKKSTTRI
jgi:ribosomal protein L32